MDPGKAEVQEQVQDASGDWPQMYGLGLVYVFWKRPCTRWDNCEPCLRKGSVVIRPGGGVRGAKMAGVWRLTSTATTCGLAKDRIAEVGGEPRLARPVRRRLALTHGAAVHDGLCHLGH